MPIRTAHLLPALLLLGSSPLSADTKVIREHRFALDDISTLEIRASVGSIDIVPASGPQLEVILQIEGKQDGWFGGARDVTEVDLQSRVRRDRLILEQTAEETETHWIVRLPAVASTQLRLGVGSIRADLADTRLEVDLGVGEVAIDYPEAAAGRLRLKVGVGEAKVHGGTGLDLRSRRAFVSEEVSGEGPGTQDVAVDVGVGEIALRLQ